MSVGKRIKERREALGLSQTDLARLTGYADKTGISKIETGDRCLNVEKIRAFAEALDVSIFYLIGEPDPVPKKKRRFVITIEEEL